MTERVEITEAALVELERLLALPHLSPTPLSVRGDDEYAWLQGSDGVFAHSPAGMNPNDAKVFSALRNAANALITAARENKRLRLMDDAVDRYLELCREGGERGVCECGDHANDCQFSERQCLLKTGGLCHWCQLDAARCGVDRENVESDYSAAKSEEPNA
jgi:hypothetical protein